MDIDGDFVRSASFGAKLRGYAPGDVDAFLEQIAKELDGMKFMAEGVERKARGEALGASIEEASFGAAIRGYNPAEVDQMLATIAAACRRGD